MTPDIRGHHVAEWADLVGESVPDGVVDGAERPASEPWDDGDADHR